MRILILALSLLLSACAGLGRQIPIQQGNIVTQEMVAALKPGMTKKQVEYVMGTPVLDTPFASEKWDYVYLEHKNHQPLLYQHVIIVFKAGYLHHVEGKINPSLRYRS